MYGCKVKPHRFLHDGQQSRVLNIQVLGEDPDQQLVVGGQEKIVAAQDIVLSLLQGISDGQARHSPSIGLYLDSAGFVTLSPANTNFHPVLQHRGCSFSLLH